MNQQQVFKAINRRGAFEALSELNKAWHDWKERHEGSGVTHFKDMRKNLGLSTRTLNLALETLQNLDLVAKDRRDYLITDLGLYVFPLMKDIKTVLETRRTPVLFSEAADPRSWCAYTARLVIGASDELLITTRWLSSCRKPELRDDLLLAFQRAKEREVRIKIIADPKMSDDIRNMFEREFGAKIRFLPWKSLANPPKFLSPIFLQDFGHVMIADRIHWLYILPHEKETEHTGRCCFNDHAIAAHLAKIFETFWVISAWKTRAAPSS